MRTINFFFVLTTLTVALLPTSSVEAQTTSEC